MPRPCKLRRISRFPNSSVFKPEGMPAEEREPVRLSLDEFEALRLADGEGLYQEDAARKMGVSRQTFGSIIDSARGKTADFIIHGKTLIIEGGPVRMDRRNNSCPQCGHAGDMPFGPFRPCGCNHCDRMNIHGSSDRQENPV